MVAEIRDMLILVLPGVFMRPVIAVLMIHLMENVVRRQPQAVVRVITVSAVTRRAVLRV